MRAAFYGQNFMAKTRFGRIDLSAFGMLEMPLEELGPGRHRVAQPGQAGRRVLAVAQRLALKDRIQL
jgi:hypothetical protein